MANQIYWGAGDELWRANLDGSNDHIVLTDLPIPGVVQGIFVDPIGGQLYSSWWSGAQNTFGRVIRSERDGADATQLGGAIRSGPIGIAADFDTQQIFWAKQYDREGGAGKVIRSDWSGENRVGIVADTYADTLAIDPQGQRVIWAEWFGAVGGPCSIYSAGYDGSNVQRLPIDGFYPTGVTFVPEPSALLMGTLGALLMIAKGRRRPG